jgi:beta-aspartyl-peptidase (threonine type)
MKRTGMAIHAGAGPDSEFVRNNQRLYKNGLLEALQCGISVLNKKGSALDAVEAAIRAMEDNPIFNAGRGSTLNSDGQIQMYASIMDGNTLRAGAGCLLTNIKNPISFARRMMDEGKSVFLGGPAAIELAKELGLEMEPELYFITDLQVKNFLEERAKCKEKNMSFNPAVRGTVGAVALDHKGNLAAGTSTGGTIYSQPGRIGDTSMIGVGTYADNRVCAVSCTGDGDVLIRNVLAHNVFTHKEYIRLDMQKTCDFVIGEKLRGHHGDMGVIGIDADGRIGIACNTERMHRAWQEHDSPPTAMIYLQTGNENGKG